MSLYYVQSSQHNKLFFIGEFKLLFIEFALNEFLSERRLHILQFKRDFLYYEVLFFYN
jgi:hypothetical protein